MNSSIEIAIKTLGEAMRAEVRSANARAAEAEKRLHAVAAGLRTLISKLPAPANDCDAPAITRVSAGTKRPPSVPDEDFLNALTYQWITASNLWKRLKERGVMIGEGTVYNRMRKLAAENPFMLEATDMPERWRRRSPIRSQDGEKTETSNVAGKRNPRAAKPRLLLVSNESSTGHSGKGGSQ